MLAGAGAADAGSCSGSGSTAGAVESGKLGVGEVSRFRCERRTGFLRPLRGVARLFDAVWLISEPAGACGAAVGSVEVPRLAHRT